LGSFHVGVLLDGEDMAAMTARVAQCESEPLEAFAPGAPARLRASSTRYAGKMTGIAAFRGENA
jgi:hypothetical protein